LGGQPGGSSGGQFGGQPGGSSGGQFGGQPGGSSGGGCVGGIISGGFVLPGGKVTFGGGAIFSGGIFTFADGGFSFIVGTVVAAPPFMAMRTGGALLTLMALCRGGALTPSDKPAG